MVGKTKKPTKAESVRFTKIIALGCICCRIEAVLQPLVTEAHHLLSGGRRRGHAFSIPLCSWHHRGVPTFPMKAMTNIFGPSLRLESRAFHERYGSDDKLLTQVNELIGVNS